VKQVPMRVKVYISFVSSPRVI